MRYREDAVAFAELAHGWPVSTIRPAGSMPQIVEAFISTRARPARGEDSGIPTNSTLVVL